MTPKHMMFMGLIFAVGTFISLTFGGLWLGADEVDVQNAVAVFKQVNILGVWAVMVPNITFFLIGVRSLIAMDFAFFGGVLGLLQWMMLLIFGLGLLWGIYTIVIGVVNGLFGRR